jgi:hypothetical protein
MFSVLALARTRGAQMLEAHISLHPRAVLDRPFDGGFMTRLWRLCRWRDGYVNEELVNWRDEGTALPISPTAGGLHGVLLAIL